MKEIAVFGGSFDPPHICHQLVVCYVLSMKPVDEIWVLPCFTHPFAKSLGDFDHRMKMCELAFSQFGDVVRVLPFERERGGINYTVDLIEALSSTHPLIHFSLILGSDSFGQKKNWKNFERIEQLVSLIIIPRNVQDCQFFLPDVSSTIIRAILGSGGQADHLLPRRVLEYIERNDLYRG